MNRGWQATLAAVLAAIALLAVPVALDDTSTSYLIPSAGGPATRHRAVFVPGVVAAALAALVALAALGWMVAVLVGRPPRWVWGVVGGVVALDLGVVAAVSALPHPAF